MPRKTALDSPQLTASERAQLIAAGQRLTKATDQAKATFDRNTRRHVEQRDRSIAAAQEGYDAVVAAILAAKAGSDA